MTGDGNEVVAELAAIDQRLTTIDRGYEEINQHLDRLLALLDEQPGEDLGPVLRAGVRALGGNLALMADRLATMSARIANSAGEVDDTQPTTAADLPPEA
jgi:hypothetical protein